MWVYLNSLVSLKPEIFNDDDLHVVVSTYFNASSTNMAVFDRMMQDYDGKLFLYFTENSVQSCWLTFLPKCFRVYVNAYTYVEKIQQDMYTQLMKMFMDVITRIAQNPNDLAGNLQNLLPLQTFNDQKLEFLQDMDFDNLTVGIPEEALTFYKENSVCQYNYCGPIRTQSRFNIGS